MKFPNHFVWGAAAASYQIEGGATADGKGLSVWDMLCRQPGRIADGSTGNVACDHYHRYKEDVALMKEMSLKAYRLSISWPRVLPTGKGNINSTGLSFYDRLVDELLEAGIAPWVTLFHWDFPYDLYCQGGWLNRDSADWFADYTTIIVDRLSDRVSNWMTLNEPQCFIGLGLEQGRHAPGDKLRTSEIFRAAHHALLAHGRAVKVIRSQSKQPATIGWAPVGVATIPNNENDPADIEAARQAMFACDNSIANPWDVTVVWNNTWWADPVVLGHYPADGLKVLEQKGIELPIQDGDMEIISAPIDFYGVNIYNGKTVRAGANGKPETVERPPGFPLSAIKWPVTPSCLRWAPRFFAERYKLPIVITENGMSCNDWISEDGQCHDPQRIDFLSRSLKELGRAINEGTDVRGYFQWSIMDNFEWAEGYRERFGLIHVDYETQKRTVKDSGHWYKKIIDANDVP